MSECHEKNEIKFELKECECGFQGDRYTPVDRVERVATVEVGII